jgi:hypothetical protein
METRLTRRELFKVSGSSVGLYFMASSFTLLSGGCTFGSVFSQIQAWVPVGLNAFNGVLTILEGAGVINPIAGSAVALLIQTIQAAFAQLAADVQAYQSITPPPAGALAKIEATLGIIVTHFQAFLSSINISDNKIVTLVVGLVQIILSTIAGFQSQLPTAAAAASRTLQVSGQTIAIVPVKRSVKQFKKDFNAACGSHTEAFIH